MTPRMAFFARLLVTDVNRSLAAWEALGFAVVARDGGMVHVRWPSGGDVVLVPLPKQVGFDAKRGAGVLLSFSSEEKVVEGIAGKATSAGLEVQGPSDTPWRTRELIVSDPDGYRLVFLEPVG